MAKKAVWKARAREAQARYENMDRMHTLARKEAMYHREAHQKAAQALQMATTSPDTKSAHEMGYISGLRRGRNEATQNSTDVREILTSLQKPLVLLADAEKRTNDAASALKLGLVTLNDRITEIANPNLKGAEKPAEEIGF